MSQPNKNRVCDCCTKFWDDLSEVRKHTLNAQKELLLAVRAAVDLLLEKAERHSSTAGARKVVIK
jgi:hypothetical protein